MGWCTCPPALQQSQYETCPGCRDLERKHAQDRELWKKDTAAAVKAAREEMMALVGVGFGGLVRCIIAVGCAVGGSRQLAAGPSGAAW